LTGYIAAGIASESLESEISLKLKNTADLKIQKIEEMLHRLNDDIFVISNLKIVLEDFSILNLNSDQIEYDKSKQNLDELFQDFVHTDEEVVEVFLIDKNYKVVYASLKQHQRYVGNDSLLRDFDSFISESEISFSNAFADPDGEENAIMFSSAPMRNSDGALIGYVIFEIDIDNIINSIQDTLGLGETGETLVGYLDENNFAVFIHPLRHDPNAAFNLKIHIDDKVALPIRDAVQGLSGGGNALDYRGIPVIAEWRYIPLVKWGMVAKIDQVEAFAPIRSLEQDLFMITLSSSVLVAIIGFFLSRNVIKPIIMLKDNSFQIAKGIFPRPIPIYGKDELSELTMAFNQMSLDLEQSKERIEIQSNELIKSEKLASIGQLASRIAHDLRNPMSVIKNTLELLKLENQSEKSQRYIKIMAKSMERMKHQIDDVMDFVKVQPLRTDWHSISSIINLAIEYIIKPESVTINFKDANMSLQIKCDAQKLGVVFTNLIINAIQAVNDRGTITIRTKDEGSFVLIEFEDDGAGIPEEYMDKIFDPLFTTKQTGTGLGLVSCKNIVTQHGGTISVRNHPTIFEIRLPKEAKISV
jgi:two-component system sensor histidine kinase HydH